jgi:hypothetical protein
MPEMVCRIRGIGMTEPSRTETARSYLQPSKCRPINHDLENLLQNFTLGVSAPLHLSKMNYGFGWPEALVAFVSARAGVALR